MNSTQIAILETNAVDGIVHELNSTLHGHLEVGTHSRVMLGVESLETHLRRLYGIDECNGLLEIIAEVHPEFAHEAHRIQSERDAILTEAHRLVIALENPHSPSDASLHLLMKELRKLIASILQHEHHERAILIDSANVDRGGEA